ncbi:response regulator transcription factor [Bifidobacterium vespertilionis]|uniref:Response regulator transcription factor n=2 Tax=Bifidobacterium vespertilionis TaxID=2562524 RepID=A0A5J5E391_9BIFI|nr:response regulator transcription factor [Bifidobacterium vespertilionis]KAA8823444.1 response regulator transcription factor [Bifidobacterium vespertilionis]
MIIKARAVQEGGAMATASTPFTIGVASADTLALRMLRIILLDRIPEATLLWCETTGRAAVEHCAKDARKPDLVLINLVLRGLQGLNSCRLIRRGSSRIKLLVMQTVPDAHARDKAIRAGVQGLVGKDDDTVLVNAIRSIAAGGTMDGFDTAPHAHDALVGQLGQHRGQHRGQLTKREMEIMDMIAANMPAETICATLGISPETLRSHRRNIRNKMHAANDAQAVIDWDAAEE